MIQRGLGASSISQKHSSTSSSHPGIPSKRISPCTATETCQGHPLHRNNPKYFYQKLHRKDLPSMFTDVGFSLIEFYNPCKSWFCALFWPYIGSTKALFDIHWQLDNMAFWQTCGLCILHWSSESLPKLAVIHSVKNWSKMIDVHSILELVWDRLVSLMMGYAGLHLIKLIWYNGVKCLQYAVRVLS